MLNHYFNFVVLFHLCITICSINTSCPPEEIIEPCSCIDDIPYYYYPNPYHFEIPSPNEKVIVCENITNILLDLQQVFIKISSYVNSISNQNSPVTHFNYFILSNTTLSTIPENVFVNITFKKLMLRNNLQLTTIHQNAFIHTKDYVQSFETINTSLSDSDTLFSILKQFQNLRYLSMQNDQIKSIPSYAFNHTHLTDIYFGYEYSKQSQPIESIGDYAFYNLPNLSVMSIVSPVLSKITKYVFAQGKRYIRDNYERSMLQISISGENLTSTSFELTSLSRFRGRTVYFRLWNTSVTYLDENIFQPFLESNPDSTITIYSENNLFGCDCRSTWIKGDYWWNLGQRNQRIYMYSPFECDFTQNCTTYR